MSHRYNEGSKYVNLLSNSQFMSCSGSTLCEVTSGAAPVTDGANAALVNNLITNGGFDSDTTGWSVQNCSIASVAGGKTGNCLEITRTAGEDQYVTTQISGITIGKLYQFSAWIKSGTSGDETYQMWVSEQASGGGTQAFIRTAVSSGSWVQVTSVFEATLTSYYLGLNKNSTTAGTMLFDSVTLYEVTPGYVAADKVAPDTWAKSSDGMSLYREHNGSNTKAGSFYALKSVSSTYPKGYWTTLDFSKCAGRTMTLGRWLKTSTANAIRISISDDAGATNTYSAYHTGSGNYEWLEVTKAISVSATGVFFTVWHEATTTCYDSQPMLVYGSSIGQGNYQPIPNEVIWLQKPVSSTLLHNKTGLSYTAMTLINIEADSSGKVGKGVKAVQLLAEINDSGSAATSVFLYTAESSTIGTAQFFISAGGLTNDVVAHSPAGWQKCDSNGDMSYVIGASGSGTFDIPVFRYLGIQT